MVLSILCRIVTLAPESKLFKVFANRPKGRLHRIVSSSLIGPWIGGTSRRIIICSVEVFIPYFGVMSNLYDDMVWHSLLGVQAKGILSRDAQDTMHLSRTHFLASFRFAPFVRQVRRFLPNGNVDIRWQVLVYLRYDLLQVAISLLLLNALENLGNK